MLSAESLPPKQDTASTTSPTTCDASEKKADTNGVNCGEATTNSTATGTTTTISNDMANAQAARFQFGAKAKRFRDMLTQTTRAIHMPQLDTDHQQLVFIIFISVVAVLASLAALITSSWTCDGKRSFGLWNTCHRETFPVNLHEDIVIVNLNVTANETIMSGASPDGIMCAKQGLHEVHVVLAEQSRIDQVTASQGLIVCGSVLYILSVVSLMLAFNFMQAKNLNSMRNALVTSLMVQVISFLMQLIGFFLFILTDRLSISVGLLFIFFGLAIFATNIINFITIEYKSYKKRQITI